MPEKFDVQRAPVINDATMTLAGLCIAPVSLLCPCDSSQVSLGCRTEPSMWRPYIETISLNS